MTGSDDSENSFLEISLYDPELQHSFSRIQSSGDAVHSSERYAQDFQMAHRNDFSPDERYDDDFANSQDGFQSFPGSPSRDNLRIANDRLNDVKLPSGSLDEQRRPLLAGPSSHAQVRVPVSKSSSNEYFHDDFDWDVVPPTPTIGRMQTKPAPAKAFRPVVQNLQQQGANPAYTNQNTSRSGQRSKHFPDSAVVIPKNERDLVPISILHNREFEKIFSFTHFNKVQSHAFDSVYNSNQNLIISSPTGSGKTVLLELAILQLLKSQTARQETKVIYIAPTKALCEERANDWKKFNALNYSCALLTGDTTFQETSEIQKSNIIVTTPEKWDSTTRQWKDSKNIMKYVHLLLVDEIHFLKDASRGGTLEVVISRMKSMQKIMENEGEYGFPALRIVGISATIPNLNDFQDWLSDGRGNNAKRLMFGEEFRAVPLNRYVFGYPLNGNPFTFETNLKYKLMELIQEYSNSRPVLVFCSTRKSTVNTAEHLVNEVASMNPNPFVPQANQTSLVQLQSKILDKKLALCVTNGVAFHHGGLEASDRREIEQMFTRGLIRVICTTSTLAVGVNLPAHLVIIKGTAIYNPALAKTCEYSDHDLMQMIGRAGRPQFDKEGTAIILTTSNRQHALQHLITGKEIIESSLHESLLEHLNAEIVLGTIKSKQSAMEWLQSTFLYVRIKKNPAYYRIKNCSREEAMLSAEKRLEAIFLKDLDLLQASTIVRSDHLGFHGTDYGNVMAKYYLKYKTVKNFIELKQSPTEEEIFLSLCHAEEFDEVRFHSDKGLLNTLNKNPAIKFPVDRKVTTVAQKTSLCIQAYLADISIEDSAAGRTHNLSNECKQIYSTAMRLCRGMLDIFIAKNDFYSLCNALKIAKSITLRLWDNSSTQLKQVPGLGLQYTKLLSAANITTFEQLALTESSKIELIISRNPPFGVKIHSFLEQLPKLRMDIIPLGRPSPNKNFSVKLSVQNKENVLKSFKGSPIFVYFICGTSGGQIIDFHKFTIQNLIAEQTLTLKAKFPNNTDTAEFYLIISEFDIHKVVKPTSLEKVESKYFSVPEPTTITATQDKFDDYWDDFDDDLLDIGDLIDIVAEPRKENILPNGNISCNHNCKSKQTCHHLCCREGVTPKTLKKRIQKSKSADNGLVASSTVTEGDRFKPSPVEPTHPEFAKVADERNELDEAISKASQLSPISSIDVSPKTKPRTRVRQVIKTLPVEVSPNHWSPSSFDMEFPNTIEELVVPISKSPQSLEQPIDGGLFIDNQDTTLILPVTPEKPKTTTPIALSKRVVLKSVSSTSSDSDQDISEDSKALQSHLKQWKSTLTRPKTRISLPMAKSSKRKLDTLDSISIFNDKPPKQPTQTPKKSNAHKSSLLQPSTSTNMDNYVPIQLPSERVNIERQPSEILLEFEEDEEPVKEPKFMSKQNSAKVIDLFNDLFAE